MDPNITPAEYAQRVIDAYTRGFICPGEVWNQVSDHATPDTLGEFMSRLTPELHAYFQRVVLDNPNPRSEQERVLLGFLQEWYARRIG